jgi:glycosyltransferase involved in cell wall biosynthesis
MPIHYVPLALSGPAPSRRAVPKRGAGGPYRLVAFGFLGRNRRLSTLLKAFADAAIRAAFILDIYGEIEEHEEVTRLIHELRLEDRVQVHGFVSREVLETALDRADLAVNLRYPSMGEASASQLRIWAHGLPSIVTRTGWYASLPEDAVLFVDPETELADLLRHLRSFAANPDPFREMGRRGSEIAFGAHMPQAYAAALARIASQHANQRRRKAAIDLAQISGGLIGEMMGADVVRFIGPSVADAIASVTGSA